MDNSQITPNLLHEILEYSAIMGVFIWRERARKFFLSDRAHAIWNARYANRRKLQPRISCQGGWEFEYSVVEAAYRGFTGGFLAALNIAYNNENMQGELGE